MKPEENAPLEMQNLTEEAVKPTQAAVDSPMAGEAMAVEESVTAASPEPAEPDERTQQTNTADGGLAHPKNSVSDTPAVPATATAGKRRWGRLVALCGALVMLSALFVVLCGLALNPQGVPGATGSQGAQGEQGLQGEPGMRGERGPQGEQGLRGEQGVQGEQGIQGIQGVPGKSAYELYCEQYGYTGTEEEWMQVVHERLSIHTSQEIYALAEACTVTVEAFRDGILLAKGSGFFMDPQGRIMTAYHVIDGATRVKVTMPDSAVYEVTGVVAFDKMRDLAVIRIGASRETPYLTLETEGVSPGETVYTFGSTNGGLDGAFSSGVVASQLTEAPLQQGNGSLYEFQYTCSIPMGNSGAPILNAHGNVIGIVTKGYMAGGTLNTATYIGEAVHLDMTYNRSVADFFADTEYYRIKMQESMCREMENNNTMKVADVIESAGLTFEGTVTKDDPDYYTFEITGNESVDFTMLFSVTTVDYYNPILIPASGTNIELTWLPVESADVQTYGARVTLTPGIYYLAINGHYSDLASAYSLYTYWRPISERNGFGYAITFEDALR